MDRLRGGGTTGVGAEVASAEAEREREEEGGVGVNEGGRHNCCYPWWIHTTNEGGTDFTQRATERGSQVPKGGWKHRDGKRADDPETYRLALPSCGGLIYTSTLPPHACTVTRQTTNKHTFIPRHYGYSRYYEGRKVMNQILERNNQKPVSFFCVVVEN